MDVLDRIVALRKMRDWTEYRLAQEADMPQATINAWYNKSRKPTLEPLEKICKAFGITMSQFFMEDLDTPVALTPEQADMLEHWTALNDDQQQAVYTMIKAFTSEK